MQAVGRGCDNCGEKIHSTLEGSACGACRVAFHHQCLEDPERCAECGVELGASEIAEENAHAARSWRLIQRGRILVATSCLAVFAAQSAANWITLSASTDDLQIFKVLIRLTLLGGLLWMTFLGRPWARTLLAGLVLIGLTLATVLGLLAAPALLALAAVDVCAVIVLFAPPSVREYMRARRAEHHERRAIQAT
jgi:hypothetical protein